MIRKLSLLSAVIATSLPAYGVALISDLGAPNSFDFSSNATIGYSFTSSDPLTVTALGMWDEGQDGFASRVDVGLWTDSGVLLEMVTLPAGTGATLVGDFRYVDLVEPVNLEAGSEYVLGGFRLPGVTYSAYDTVEGVDFMVSPGIDIIVERASSQFGGEPSIEFPGYLADDNQGLIGPNLQFDVVPEPSACALVAMIVLARSSRMWRRRL